MFSNKQELRSWFKVNAKFPSTIPAAAYMINSDGLFPQSRIDLSDPTMHNSTECTFELLKVTNDSLRTNWQMQLMKWEKELPFIEVSGL